MIPRRKFIQGTVALAAVTTLPISALAISSNRLTSFELFELLRRRTKLSMLAAAANDYDNDWLKDSVEWNCKVIQEEGELHDFYVLTYGHTARSHGHTYIDIYYQETPGARLEHKQCDAWNPLYGDFNCYWYFDIPYNCKYEKEIMQHFTFT